MSKFWELLESSVIISGIITLGCLGAVLYCVVVGQEVPKILEIAFTAILGFFFGSRKGAEEGYQKAMREK